MCPAAIIPHATTFDDDATLGGNHILLPLLR
jgi:hypothetical protein